MQMWMRSSRWWDISACRVVGVPYFLLVTPAAEITFLPSEFLTHLQVLLFMFVLLCNIFILFQNSYVDSIYSMVKGSCIIFPFVSQYGSSLLSLFIIKKKHVMMMWGRRQFCPNRNGWRVQYSSRRPLLTFLLSKYLIYTTRAMSQTCQTMRQVEHVALASPLFPT